MTPSQRVGRHLRSNVVGYIALFVALSGTALALPGKNSVKSNDIARGAVKAKAIKDLAVTNAKLADAAVTNAKLADAAVSSLKIADGSVIAADLADSAVLEAKIADDAVTRSKILAGTINGGKLANGAIDSAKVTNGSLLADDFAAGQLSDGFIAEAEPASFTLPRPGRLFLTATFVASCPTLCQYVLSVDGVIVPGSLSSGADQPTLIGVTAPLSAGPHTVDISAGGGASFTEPTIAAVLLQ
jgi:hypothetical protein